MRIRLVACSIAPYFAIALLSACASRTPVTDPPLSCGPLEVVRNGACECEASAKRCGTTCVDVGTDTDNCSACGMPCKGTCQAGYCTTTLTSLDEEPRAISQNTNHVFVALDKLGTVFSIDKYTAQRVTVASARYHPYAIASDDDSAGWLEQGGVLMIASTLVPTPTPTGGVSTALKVSVANGSYYVLTPTTLHVTKNKSMFQRASGLTDAVDFIAGPGGIVVATKTGLVHLDYTGTSFTPLDAHQLAPQAIDSTATDAFVATSSLDGSPTGLIGRAPLNGSPMSTVVDALDAPGSFFVDGDTVFVVARQSSGSWALLRVRGAERAVVPGAEVVSQRGCVFDAKAFYCSRPTNSGTSADLVKIVRPAP